MGTRTSFQNFEKLKFQAPYSKTSRYRWTFFLLIEYSWPRISKSYFCCQHSHIIEVIFHLLRAKVTTAKTRQRCIQSLHDVNSESKKATQSFSHTSYKRLTICVVILVKVEKRLTARSVLSSQRSGSTSDWLAEWKPIYSPPSSNDALGAKYGG